METLSDITITHAELKQEGSGWDRYLVRIDDPDWKEIGFTYFHRDNNPKPEKGMECDSIKFEKSDKYKSYLIKYINIKGAEKPIPEAEPKPTPESFPESEENKRGYYYRYATDVAIERYKANYENMVDTPVGWASWIHKCADAMWQFSEGRAPEELMGEEDIPN